MPPVAKCRPIVHSPVHGHRAVCPSGCCDGAAVGTRVPAFEGVRAAFRGAGLAMGDGTDVLKDCSPRSAFNYPSLRQTLGH